MRGVEWTAIGTSGSGRGSQEGGKVGDSFSDVLIYAGCILEGGVKGTGVDSSGSDSLDIQAPGVSRRLLPPPEAMARMTCSSPLPKERAGWWW